MVTKIELEDGNTVTVAMSKDVTHVSIDPDGFLNPNGDKWWRIDHKMLPRQRRPLARGALETGRISDPHLKKALEILAA